MPDLFIRYVTYLFQVISFSEHETDKNTTFIRTIKGGGNLALPDSLPTAALEHTVPLSSSIIDSMAAEKTYWFAVYALPGRGPKLIASLEQKGIRHYIPAVFLGGDPCQRPLPVVGGLVLIRCTQKEIFRLLRSNRLQFAVLQDKFKKIQVLPDQQTERFIRLTGMEGACFSLYSQPKAPHTSGSNVAVPLSETCGQDKSASLCIGSLVITVHVP